MKKLTLIVLMLIMMLTLHAEDINNQKIYQPGGGRIYKAITHYIYQQGTPNRQPRPHGQPLSFFS